MLEWMCEPKVPSNTLMLITRLDEVRVVILGLTEPGC